MNDLSLLKGAAVAHWLSVLRRDGYCVIPDVGDAATLHALSGDLDHRFDQTPFCEGDFYGRRTKRFGGLLKRSVHAQAFVRNSLVLPLAEAVLAPWCDRIALNLTQAIEIHPGAPAQFPHRDQDMWLGPKGEMEYLVNVIWPISSFSADNGGTLIWPGSHRHLEEQGSGQPVAIAMHPGSVLLFLGSTLHGGGANHTEAVRRGFIVSYCLGWLRPFENQWLVYPPAVARAFDPDLAALVGYSLHRPNLGNYEGQCPSILLSEDGAEEYLAATDALRPEQSQALKAYATAYGSIHPDPAGDSRCLDVSPGPST